MHDQAPALPTPTRLRVLPIVTWVLVGPFVLWAIGRIAGLDRGTPLVQLIAFTPYVAAASLIPVGLALATRQWWPAAVAVVTCVALALCVLPREFGSPSGTSGVPLTVMSMNMLEGGADTQSIVTLVRDHGVDLLTMQEYTPDGEAGLAAAGLEKLLPYHEQRPVPYTSGSAVYSRFPLSDGGAKENEGGFFQAHAVVAVPGARPVTIESVHPVAPAALDTVPLWLDDLRDQTPADAGGPPRILAGDFNSTLDHSAFRQLLATGYEDAADQVGAGLIPTWPFYGPRAAVTPKVTLDHVLVDGGIGVRSFAAFTVARTDHRAIIATLTLPTA
jgi:endonuclease/exonuclease/phosphatase (EEP) superfamily protein YafD